MARLCAALSLLLLLSLGCGKKPQAEVEFAGRAEDHKGKALTNLVLRFHPDDESNKHGKSPTCILQAEGKFAGKCLPGRYKVTLAGIPTGTGGNPGAGLTVSAPTSGGKPLPKAFTDSNNTPWKITIPEDGNNNIVLKLTP